MEHFYEKIPGWFSFSRLYTKMVQNAREDAHFVEVGCWLGRSAAFMAVEILNSKKRIKFDCVDWWNGQAEGKSEIKLFKAFLTNMLSVKDIINPIKLPSSMASKLYLDNSLDFVFIDATHEYDSVKEDIKLWYPKVKEGGILAGHDYNTKFPGVDKAVNEFLFQTNYRLIINSDFCWGIRKK